MSDSWKSKVFFVWGLTGQLQVSRVIFDCGESEDFFERWHLFLYFSFFFKSFLEFRYLPLELIFFCSVLFPSHQTLPTKQSNKS